MGIGDDGGEPMQVLANGDFGNRQAFVPVEECEDFAIDFFGGEGLGDILHGQRVECGEVVGVKDGHNDRIGGEGSATLGHGVETFQVGDTHGHLTQTWRVFGKFIHTFGA